jgi:hypothetical protein
MYATVRHSEGIDKVRSEEVTRKVGESLLPPLRKLRGFSGCYVFDDDDALPNRSKVTAGPVVAHESNGATVANGVPALT